MSDWKQILCAVLQFGISVSKKSASSIVITDEHSSTLKTEEGYTTRRHILDDGDLHSDRRENLTSHNSKDLQ
jgi:hypothetical protein